MSQHYLAAMCHNCKRPIPVVIDPSDGLRKVGLTGDAFNLKCGLCDAVSTYSPDEAVQVTFTGRQSSDGGGPPT